MKNKEWEKFEQEFHDVYYGKDYQGFSKLSKWVFDRIQIEQDPYVGMSPDQLAALKLENGFKLTPPSARVK